MGRASERTCVGCRKVRPKTDLQRLVVLDGQVVTDLAGALPGRGAYVCPNGTCAARARPRLGKALRLQGEQGRTAGTAWTP